MSKRFLAPIRLAKLENDPAGHEGDIYFNTILKAIKYFDGTSWIAMQQGGGGGDITIIEGGYASSQYPVLDLLDGGNSSGY
jgi:hypothetical protein